MAKYKITWTEEVWKETIVEAGSKEVAKAIFFDDDYDDFEVIGQEMQDSVSVEELDEDE
jgi:hypothetical protein